jgi:arsenate reductase-like glutaredoxin family protein
MEKAEKLEFLRRWLQVVFPGYLRYLSMLEKNRVWSDRFPLEQRVTVQRVLDEETSYCQRLAEMIEDLGEYPELASYPEDAARLNYLEMGVALNKTIERLEINVKRLDVDRREVSDDEEMAELLEEGIALLKKHIDDLRPLALRWSSNATPA